MNRGYFGIGVYHMKYEKNLGTLWRSAHNFGASFIFVIGKRYKRQGCDTTKAYRHLPLFEYPTYEDFHKTIPHQSRVVCIEQSEKSKDIKNFVHPESCLYLLGAEDSGIPEEIMFGKEIIHITTPMCLNVAVAGSIIMFDRLIKGADNDQAQD